MHKYVETVKSLLNKVAGAYYCLLPFGTALLYARYKQYAKSDFDTLKNMVDLNDDVYKTLNSIGFRISERHQDLRALVPRGKVTTEAIDPETVEIDAHIWLADQLRPIQSNFVQYMLEDDIVPAAMYDAERDNVMFTLSSKWKDVIEDMQRFIYINKVVTLSTVAWLALLIVAII